MLYSQFIPNELLSELHMLQKTFRLSILSVLLCPLILFVLKLVNSSEAGEDLAMFIPEGREDQHLVYDVTFKDNLLQFVDPKFLKNVQLILNNSNSDQVCLS